MRDELDEEIDRLRARLATLESQRGSAELEALQRELRTVRAQCDALEAQLAPLRDEESRLRSNTDSTATK